MLAVQDFEILSFYKKALKEFNRYFEQIEPNKTIVREVFGLYAESLKGYSFFESSKTYSWMQGDLIPVGQMKKDCFSALDKFYESNVYNDERTILLNAPLRKNLQISFNQLLSIYATMFYLGSLVRYRPDYLEKLLDSRDAWIIERFTYSAPSTFLRSMVNLILQQDYIYISR